MLCTKTYKTKGGLDRHVKAKHPENDEPIIHISKIEELVKKTQLKISNDMGYPQEIRDEILKDIQINQRDLLLEKVTCCCSEWKEKGDPDEFFSFFFDLIICEASQFFPLDYHLAGLLAVKLRDVMFSFLSNQNETDDYTSCNGMTSEEMDGLQYLAGYVIQKLIKSAKKN